MEQKAPSSPRPCPRYLLAALLLLAVGGIYLQTSGFRFLNLDDNVNIYNNPLITHFSAANLARLWQAPYGGLYIPLPYTVWACLAKLLDLCSPGKSLFLQPALFHTTNYLLHGLCALVVFALLNRLLKDEWAAWCGAMLFALHPVQVEAVAWVTGLKDVLSTLLSFTALWLLTIFCDAGQEGQRQWRWYAMATLSFLAALLCKPTTVVTPLAAAVIMGLLLRQGRKRILLTLLPWLVLALPVILITTGVQNQTVARFVPTYWQRLLVAGDALSFHLRQLLFPYRLTIDYGRTPEVVLGQGLVHVTAMMPLLLTLLLAKKGKPPWLLGAAALFVIPLLPVCGLLSFDFQRISTVADRYLYAAMLGPACLVAWTLHRYRGAALKIVFLLMIALCAGKSSVQVGYWRDTPTLFRHAMKINPGSWLAANNLGAYFDKREQFDRAIKWYRRAVSIDPDYALAHYNLGRLKADLQRPKEAIKHYQQALAIAPGYAEAHLNLGKAYLALDRPNKAIVAFKNAIQARADYARAYNWLGNAYNKIDKEGKAIQAYRQAIAIRPDLMVAYQNLGNTYWQLGESEKAIAALQRAIAVDPEYLEAYNNLGTMYLEQDATDDALSVFKKALAIEPEFVSAYANLGIVYHKLGMREEAIRSYNKALELKPDFFGAYINLGFLYSEQNAFEQAIPLFEKAMELKPQEYMPYNGLAQVLDKQGADEQAVAMYQKAIALNPGFGQAYLNLAAVYVELEQYDTAIRYADQAQALGQSDPELDEALAPYRQAR